MYIMKRVLRWSDQVSELESLIIIMYLTISWILVCGLAHVFQNRPMMSRCRAASMGGSPRRKCRGRIGE